MSQDEDKPRLRQPHPDPSAGLPGINDSLARRKLLGLNDQVSTVSAQVMQMGEARFPDSMFVE
jgi:hypothetical protein